MEDDETPRIDDDDNDDQIDQEMQELNELFSRFKADPNDDFINVNRLTEVLQAFGRNPSLRDSEERINELEMADKFELTLDDFLQILDEQWTMVNNNRDVLRQAFGKFDETQEGYIDIERFRTIMSTLGEPLTDEELEEFIQLGLNEDQTKVNIEYLLDQLFGDNA
jgi:calmodulin